MDVMDVSEQNETGNTQSIKTFTNKPFPVAFPKAPPAPLIIKP